MLDAASKKQLKENANLFMLLGIGSIVLGSLAIYFAFYSTLITVFYIGIMLIILGIFEAVQSFNLRHWSSFFLHLFLSVLYIAGGGMIVAHPLVSEINLTLLLALFFIVSGILRIIFCLTQSMPHKDWQILNGIITIILGLLIWQQWPESGLWVIGMFVGINALLTGWTWILLSYEVKKVAK